MTDSFPERLHDLENPHVKAYVDEFLGYEPIQSDSRVTTYAGENIVTIDGANGPWMARQIMGPYSGVLVEYWDDSRNHDDALEIAAEYGWVRFHAEWDPLSNEIDDTNVIDYLYRDNIEVPEITLTPEMTPRPVHVER